MKPIVVNQRVTFINKRLNKGDVIEINKNNFGMIVKLNESGYLENPLTIKELKEIKKLVNNQKKSKKEEE